MKELVVFAVFYVRRLYINDHDLSVYHELLSSQVCITSHGL